jgi:hypothetical protein
MKAYLASKFDFGVYFWLWHVILCYKKRIANRIFVPMQQKFIRNTVKRERYINDGHTLKRHINLKNPNVFPKFGFLCQTVPAEYPTDVSKYQRTDYC